MKRILFWLLPTIFHISSFGQTGSLQLTSPLPISPQAASFAKYGDIPVSLNNGVANISIPLLTIKTGAINYPVTLSYHPSGIKIEEIASNVGLGWTLSYGATITRQVRGLPDEASNGYFNSGSWVQQYIDGELTGDNAQTFLSSYRAGDVDGQQDIYYYNLPDGQSGKFFKDSTGHWVTFPKTNLNITTNGPVTLDSFTIVTDQGIKYSFFPGTSSNSTSIVIVNDGNGTDGSSFSGTTAWYLSTIVDPNGNEVDFTYGVTNAIYTTRGVETHKVPLGEISPLLPCDESIINTNMYNEIGDDKITGIKWREGQVVFSYGNTPRKDLQSTDTALSSIAIFNNENQLIKQFQLYTSYFLNNVTSIGHAGDSTFFYRLRLDSLKEVGSGGISNPPYVFGYNPLTLEDRFSNNQDYWGYYNGKNNTDFVAYSEVANGILVPAGADKSVDSNYVQADMLQEIHYPTGGNTIFEFESNRYNIFEDSTYTFGSQVIGGISGNNFANSNTPDQVLFTFDDTLYISSGNATVNGKALIQSVISSEHDTITNGDFLSIQVTLYNQDGSVNQQLLNETGTNSDQLQTVDTFLLAPGTYYLHGQIETDYPQDPNASFYDNLYLGSLRPAGRYDSLAGGVRIKRITDNNGLGVAKIKEYCYNTFGSNYSSGSIGYLNNFIQYGYTELDDEPSNDTWLGGYSCFFGVYTSTSTFPLSTSGGAYVTYANVTETEKDGADNTNGKSEYYYSTWNDYPDEISSGFPFPPSCSFEWKRGLLLRQQDYKVVPDGSYTLLREKINNYTFLSNLGDTTRRYSIGLVAAPTIVSNISQETSVNLNAQLVIGTFHTAAEIYYLQSDTTILYDMSGNGKKVVSYNTYSYKNYPILLQSQQTANSKGQIEKKTYRYPSDYGNYGFIASMNQSGLTAVPVEVLSSRTNASNVENLTSSVLTTYKPSQPVRDKIYTIQSPAPFPLSQFQTTIMGSGGSLQTDPNYQPLLQFNRYDPLGNIEEQQKTSDLVMTYIWDYHSTEPVAEVRNSDSASVAYTSFEADGTGNWTIGSGAVDMTMAITGNNSYNLSGNITKSGLNSATTYFVSYWTTNASYFNISGTVSGYPVKGKTVLINNNSWTLYVHKVTGQSTITVNGSGHIDELRLYPITAQMTTYTYKPLIGITSQTDVGNRVTYYEYDGLARLKRIRDQDYNILKTIDYQYQAPGGCGSGCTILGMETLIGSNTPGYPVGVFDVHGNLVGNASGQSTYDSLWNSDTADARIGTLAPGSDPMHFKLTLNTGQTAPAGVTGCRYYQYDLPYTEIDGLTFANGTYVDFGDGTRMHLPKTASDTPAVMAPNTIRVGFYNPFDQVWWFIHTYPDTSLKTITIYHNEIESYTGLDNGTDPAISLTKVRNFRGNIPQSVASIGGSCYQQSSALTVANITNWNSISSVTSFWAHCGDGINASENMSYAQDFMANNRGLQVINTTQLTYYKSGYTDTTFKISRLKSDWNTYFTNLGDVEICDDQWNHEDLTALTHLYGFVLTPTNQNHSNNATSNPITPINSAVIDAVINQIAAGAGQSVSNGSIYIVTGGSGRTTASDAAVAILDAKHWTVQLDGIFQ
jgi:YD repeat-containing protein